MKDWDFEDWLDYVFMNLVRVFFIVAFVTILAGLLYGWAQLWLMLVMLAN